MSNILSLVLLLCSICVSYLILYAVILNSIQINHLEQEAFHDSLTGLGNRAKLWRDLNVLLEADKIFSVVFMDLNRFKEINDHFGHMIGDKYLTHFGHICLKIIQDQGQVYRFGGDEFIVLYYGEIPQETIRQLTDCREWDDGAPCPFNKVSAGVLICRPPHKSGEEILHQVDLLMYQQKNTP